VTLYKNCRKDMLDKLVSFLKRTKSQVPTMDIIGMYLRVNSEGPLDIEEMNYILNKIRSEL